MLIERPWILKQAKRKLISRADIEIVVNDLVALNYPLPPFRTHDWGISSGRGLRALFTCPGDLAPYFSKLTFARVRLIVFAPAGKSGSLA